MKSVKEQKVASVQSEIARERAASLGLSERRLRNALSALNRQDAGGAGRRSRAQLLQEATEACLGYVVQREAMGLGQHDLRAMRAELEIPDEVWNRMGVVAVG